MHKFLAETRPGSKVISLGNFFPLTFFWGVKTKGKKMVEKQCYVQNILVKRISS